MRQPLSIRSLSRSVTTSVLPLLSRNVRLLCGALLLPLLLTGLQAQTAHFSYAQVTLGSISDQPDGVAVDGSGNVFFTVPGSTGVEEIPSGCVTSGCIKTLGNGFNQPLGVAVDRSGNLFVADTNNKAVKEILAAGGYSTIITLGGGFNGPAGIAVDGSGNVFVGDASDNTVKEIPSGCATSSCVKTLASGFGGPEGIAVDGSGNVFVADVGNRAVKEILAAGGYTTINTLASGIFARSLALDGSGNIVVTDWKNGAVKEILATGGYATVNTLASGFNSPWGVAVDGNGNVFVADYYNDRVVELETAAVNFGSVNISSTSPVLSLIFIFDSAGTLGSAPSVLTMGASGLDFADAGTGTCTTNGTTHAYSTGDTCTVDVTFTPKFSGLRNGGVVLTGSSGNVIATGYVHGVGSGPQVNFLPGSQSTLGGGLSGPMGVAVDGSGNVYVADPTNYALDEIPSGCVAASCVKTLVYGQAVNFQPRGISIDGSGNIFVADVGVNAVEKIPSGCAASDCVIKLGMGNGGYGTLGGVAVDGNGNVFFTDAGDSAVHEILAAGGYATVKTLGSGFYLLNGIAVDGSGNVFVADSTNNAVKEILVAGGYTTVLTLGSGFSNPEAIAIDGNGNVFVSTGAYATSAVHEILAAGGYTTVNTVDIGFGGTLGFALDGSGNLFAAGNHGVVKLDFADPPSLNFGSVTAGLNSAEQTVTLQNIGNAPLTLPVPASGSNPSSAQYFTLDNSASTACPVVTSSSAAESLDASASCTLAISFTPTVTGPFNGSVAVTDDALNASPLNPASPAYATQMIALSGTGAPQAAQTITFPNPGTQTYSVAPITLNASASSGLAVSYSVTSGPATVSGSALTFTGVGSVTVQATQSGNISYAAATPVSVTFTVNAGSQTITFPNPGTQTYGVAPITLKASASSGLAVSYSVTSGPATVSGNALTITGAGSVTVQAAQSGNGDYSAATPVSVTFTVNTASQKITFPNPGTQTDSVAPITLNASASSGLPVSYSVMSGPATVSGNALTITGAGSVTVQATQSGNANYAAATPVSVTFTTIMPAPTYTLVASSASVAIVNGVSSPSVTIAAGSSSTVVLTLGSINYAGTVSFRASYNSQVSVGAPSVTLTNGGSGSSTVTLTTATSAANHEPGVPWNYRGALVFCVALLAVPFKVRRKRACAILLTALTISLAGFLIACGSSSTQARQARTYLVTLTPTGSGTVTDHAPVNIQVTVP